MTAKERLKRMLTNRGMFDSQADAVLEIAIPIIESEIGIVWNRPANEYPDAVYATVWIFTIKKVALEWIDENKPKAWYRPLFI